MIYFVGPPGLLPYSDDVVQSTIDNCVNYLKGKAVLALDTETSGLDHVVDRVQVLQIGDEIHQYVIDTRHVDITPLNPFLSSRKIIKVLHNASFDYRMLRATFNIRLENIWDTMLMEQVLNTGISMSFSLKETLNRYGMAIRKSEETQLSYTQLGSKPLTLEQITYAGEDIKNLVPLARLQFDALTMGNLMAVGTLENSACLAFGDMEYNGLTLDTQAWRKLARRAEETLAVKLKELNDYVESDPKYAKFKKKYLQTDLFTPVEELPQMNINWDSPLQAVSVLRVEAPALVGVNAKVDLVPYKKLPIVQKYIEYKEQAKLVSSYGESFITKNLRANGKVHTSFFQILETGRVSSSGPNMQQIPKSNEYRNCFVPSYSGWKFVSSDYSSQELCIIASGSNDPVWLNSLRHGEDLHSVCAELIFKDKWKDAAEEGCLYYQSKKKCKCKQHGKLRDFVKTINFGLAYGMTEHKLSAQLQIPLEEASDLITSFFHTFPSIKKFLDMLGSFAVKRHFITTYPPYQRKRFFPELSKPGADYKVKGEVERAGKNTPIQGSAADMTKRALVLIREEINANNWPVELVMTVHDQIDTIVEGSRAEEWAVKMTELMEQAALEIIPSGLLKAETSITDVWSK